MRISSFGCTTVGKVRDHNEDSWLALDSEYLYVVADGMGGHKGGELASSVTVDGIRAFFEQTASPESFTWPMDLGLRDIHASRLVSAVYAAHRKLCFIVEGRPMLEGMGTTVVAAYLVEDNIHLAHVGDSRCYRLRAGRLEPLTRDHSLLNQVLSDPNFDSLRKEELASISHVLVRALGAPNLEASEIEHHVISLRRDDIFLLCSDGVTNELNDFQISEVLSSGLSPEGTARILIDRANANGGKDNATVLVVRVDQLDSSDLPTAPGGQKSA